MEGSSILSVVTAYDADAFDAYEASGWEAVASEYEEHWSSITRRGDRPVARCRRCRAWRARRRRRSRLGRRRGPCSRARSDCDRRGCRCGDGRDCRTTAPGRAVRPSLGDTLAVRRRIVRRSRRQHRHPAHRRARACGARACASARFRRTRRAVDVGRAPERSPFFATILGAVADADVPPPTGIPAGPSFFQFADDVVLRRSAARRGFHRGPESMRSRSRCRSARRRT